VNSRNEIQHFIACFKSYYTYKCASIISASLLPFEPINDFFCSLILHAHNAISYWRCAEGLRSHYSW